VLLQNGQALSGVKVAESETTLTLVDNQGEQKRVALAAIETRTSSPLSTMPEGLEQRLTEQEFVDLIAFLASLKESPTTP
jgi:putative heme-binding domain-containing protein